jgi:multidrug efflux pump subunit AcrA (membrane-fusion protein)
MLRRLLMVLAVAAVVSGVVVWKGDFFLATAPVVVDPPEAAPTTLVSSIGPPLYTPLVPSAPALPHRAEHGQSRIVLPDCRLTVMEKQDVPSQRDGVILFVGSEIEPGHEPAPDQVVRVMLGGQEQRFRRLKEGDPVRPGQLLAYLDDQLSRDDWAIKKARVASAHADLDAAIKNCDEAKNRYDTQLWLRREGHGATAEEDVRAAKLIWDKAACEAIARREAVTLAERELSQAETVLRMHQVRSSTAGVVKTILKRPGEAVKSFEPVVQVHQTARLRVEGLVDASHLPRLHTGMKALVEPSQPEAPRQVFAGHLQDVTSVGVGIDVGEPVILSASEDATVRVWDIKTGRERRALRHPAAVLAVAGSAKLCLSGAADGSARLWRLDGSSYQPLRELRDGHTGAITCVAFNPDGRLCATGGDDRGICIWDVTAGTLLYKLPAGHRGAVTCIQFTPRSQLVSAGRDQTLRVWSLGRTGARLDATFDQRSGEVAQLGVSADGGRALFDQGNLLRLLTLPDGRTDGFLENLPRSARFTTFALFSPDGRFILTAGGTEGRLHLWRSPTATTRATELRQFVTTDGVGATCAAFAPGGSFVVVGGRDRRLWAWPVPLNETREPAQPADVVMIDRAVENSTREARVWAELPNPDGRWLPGTTVTMVLGEE